MFGEIFWLVQDGEQAFCMGAFAGAETSRTLFVKMNFREAFVRVLSVY